MITVPLIGTPVLYYANAEREAEPIPGVVTESNRNAVCRLVLFLRNGDTTAKSAVYNIHSKDIYTEKGELKEGARRAGAWDFHPWYSPPPPPAPAAARDPVEFPYDDDDDDDPPDDYGKSLERVTQDKEAKILSYMAENGDFNHVFKRARSLGITKADLELLFQKHGLALT